MMRISLLSFVLAMFASSTQSGSGQMSPFVCDRLALTPEARTRHFDQLGPQLRALGTGVRELPNGYAFRFPADPATVALVAEWAAGERLCCPFFEIDIRLDPEHGPLWLTLTGREGTKNFIRADLPKWIQR
jgi:hypothetical protein